MTVPRVPFPAPPVCPALDISDPTILGSPHPSRFDVPFELISLDFATVSHEYLNLESVSSENGEMRGFFFCSTNKQVDSINTELESL